MDTQGRPASISTHIRSYKEISWDPTAINEILLCSALGLLRVNCQRERKREMEKAGERINTIVINIQYKLKSFKDY